MKFTKRITALLLAVITVVCALAGCSSKPQWAYKSDDAELASGVYIYSLYVAYNQAQSLASEVEGYDSKKSFLDLEIKENEDDEPMKADKWIKEKADKLCTTVLAVVKECKAKGVEPTAEDLTAASAQAKSDWEFGPYYQYYAAMGYSSTPFKTVLEKYGVSYASFELAGYTATAQQTALFDSIYAEGGTKEVKDDELKKFFTDNYTDYRYLRAGLTKTEADDEGNDKTVDMTEDEIKELEAVLQGYVDAMNSGEKKFSDIADEYSSLKKLENDPSVSKTEILADSTVNEDVVAQVEKLGDNKAALVKSGEGSSAAYYVVFKGSIEDAVESNFDTDDKIYSYLIAYKGDEFTDYVNELTQAMRTAPDYKVNTSVVNGYKPKMFEK